MIASTRPAGLAAAQKRAAGLPRGPLRPGPLRQRLYTTLRPSVECGAWLSLPLSLFHKHERLPPDGMTMMREDERCDPEESICRTPSHTFECACEVCSGTGWSRSRSGSWGHGARRGGGGGGGGGHRGGGLMVCMACQGLGYVRHTTARFVPDSPDHLTLARAPPQPAKRPLFEPRKQRQHQQQPSAHPSHVPGIDLVAQPRAHPRLGVAASWRARRRQQQEEEEEEEHERQKQEQERRQQAAPAAPRPRTPRMHPQPQAPPAPAPQLRVQAAS